MRPFNKGVLPPARVICDPLRTLTYGTDASFYRLIPRLVLKADDEAEVTAILRHDDRRGLPVTFRAAGTSLSGQAVADSVLVMTGHGWKGHEILDNGQRIRLQPGVIGGHANRYLALNSADIVSIGQQVRGEAVAETVAPDQLVNAG